jgi:lipid-binding SYLF domain-containing protein
MKKAIIVMQILLAGAVLTGCQTWSRSEGPGTGTNQASIELDRDARDSLQKLFQSSATARNLYPSAKAVLIFPNVVKAGLIFGGQLGQGALLVNNKTEGYYRTTAASYGLQAGAQSFGYAMFLMSDKAIRYLDETHGWEIGVGPTVVIMDEGAAGSFTTTTAKDDVYAFFFDQEGLMAGLGIQGSKITRIYPKQ